MAKLTRGALRKRAHLGLSSAINDALGTSSLDWKCSDWAGDQIEWIGRGPESDQRTVYAWILGFVHPQILPQWPVDLSAYVRFGPPGDRFLPREFTEFWPGGHTLGGHIRDLRHGREERGRRVREYIVRPDRSDDYSPTRLANEFSDHGLPLLELVGDIEMLREYILNEVLPTQGAGTAGISLWLLGDRRKARPLLERCVRETSGVPAEQRTPLQQKMLRECSDYLDD